jgi:hypothetical protein
MIFGAPNVPIVGVQILLEQQKQRRPPLDLACVECLSVQLSTNLS